MSFKVSLVGNGISAWRFLKATHQQQRDAFAASAQVTRATERFAAKAGSFAKPEDVMADRIVRQVALQSFGLQDDIDNIYFMTKILDDGTSNRDALANRLADSRYRDFSAAFGFGEVLPPRVQEPGFTDRIVSRYIDQGFELAVGQTDDALRQALNFDRMLPQIAKTTSSNDAAWFKIMGTPNLRNVVETALGLPKAFGRIDLDQQLESLKDLSRKRFGSDEMRDIASGPIREKAINLFLLRQQVSRGFASSSNAIALQLLS